MKRNLLSCRPVYCNSFRRLRKYNQLYFHLIYIYTHVDIQIHVEGSSIHITENETLVGRLRRLLGECMYDVPSEQPKPRNICEKKPELNKNGALHFCKFETLAESGLFRVWSTREKQRHEGVLSVCPLLFPDLTAIKICRPILWQSVRRCFGYFVYTDSTICAGASQRCLKESFLGASTLSHCPRTEELRNTAEL